MTRGTVENILLVRENPENQQRVSGKNFYFSLSLVTGVQVFVRNFRGGIGGDSKQKVSPFRDEWVGKGGGGGVEFPFLAHFQFKASSRTVKLRGMTSLHFSWCIFFCFGG